MIELKNNPAGNFFLLAGTFVTEGEEMAMWIGERIVTIPKKLEIPHIFQGRTVKPNGRSGLPFLVWVTKQRCRHCKR